MATVAAALPVSVQGLSARLVENGAGTYQADFKVPANATLVDIVIEGVALWAAATSAVLDIGDSGAAQGYFAALNVKATDLLAGETISIGSTQVRGGAGGSYLTVGTSTHITRGFSNAERTITAKVTSVGAGATGDTRVTVVYAVGSPTVITQ